MLISVPRLILIRILGIELKIGAFIRDVCVLIQYRGLMYLRELTFIVNWPELSTSFCFIVFLRVVFIQPFIETYLLAALESNKLLLLKVLVPIFSEIIKLFL